MSPLSGHIVEALCVVGAVGNLLTLVVLRRTGDKKNSTNWLLRAQAIVDCLYLVTRLVACRLESSASREVERQPLIDSRLLATVASVTASLMRIVSVWTVVVVAVDRYVAVCLSGDVRLRTVRRARLAVACVVVLAAVCCSPILVEATTDGAPCRPWRDDAGPPPVDSWLAVYHVACYDVISTMIPLAVLLPLSARTVARLRRLTRQFHVITCRRCCARRWAKTLVKKTNCLRVGMSAS